MKIDKYRQSKWLKKSDVQEMNDAERFVTIENFLEEEVGEDIKPVCYFRGIKKGWPINVTALDDLAEMAGSDDTDDFIGQQVEIYVDPSVSYGGKRVGGIKLRPAKKPEKPTNDLPFDDEIPFGDSLPVEAYNDVP